MVDQADTIFRDFELYGVPSSGKHQPRKIKIREWGTWLEQFLANSVANGGLLFTTKASLDSLLNYPASTMAWVIGDPVVANNGVYQKLGGVGLGSWVRRADLPYSFVRMSDVGAGTPDAIQLTSSIPTTASMLRTANVFEANTGNVTISENGGAPKSLRTVSGAHIFPGGLISGMMIAYLDDGTNFRLLSDIASAAIIDAAEDAADAAAASAIEAADYAALARNDFVVNTFLGDGVDTTFTLSADPGSANNCIVSISGVIQHEDAYSVSGTTLTFTEAPPAPLVGTDDNIQVKYGFRVAVGTPADGSITSAKLGTNSVTTIKITDANVTKAKIADDSIDEAKLDSARKAQIRVELGCSFSAHKNAVDQTGIVPSTDTKVTFTTEDWDVGSFYDAANSRWTPPAGKYTVHFSALFNGTNMTDSDGGTLFIRKNGVNHKAFQNRCTITAGGFQVAGSCIVDANGTDQFEVWTNCGGTGNKTMNGTILYTFFQGRAI